MNATKETQTVIQGLTEAGWIRRSAFAALIGRADSGSILETARRAGVRIVQIPLGGPSGRSIPLFRPEDAHLVTNIRNESCNGDPQNGGKLLHRIINLEQRVEQLCKELGIEN